MDRVLINGTKATDWFSLRIIYSNIGGNSVTLLSVTLSSCQVNKIVNKDEIFEFKMEFIKIVFIAFPGYTKVVTFTVVCLIPAERV